MQHNSINVRCVRRHAHAIGIAVLVMILVCFEQRPARAAEGDLDQSFGKGGIVVSDLDTMPGRDGPFSEGEAIAIQPDGKIVVGAQIHLNESSWEAALARYNTDGSLDTSFGVGGEVVIAERLFPNVIAIQADGKIVMAAGEDLMRFSADGSLDPTFGNAGTVAISNGGISRLAFLPDGKILAAGTGVSAGSSTFVLLRLNPDGSPDASFGVGGQATADFPGHAAFVSSMAIQPDGKIVAGGGGQTGGRFFGAIARFNNDGSPDLAFGSSGLVATPGSRISFRAIAVLDGGKIVGIGVAGPSFIGQSGSAVFGAARYNPDGTLDSTFGNGGIVTSPFLPGPETTVVTAAIDPHGRFLAAGEAGYGLALARYNIDGSPDTTFGTGGSVITNVTDPKNHYPDTIRAIAFQTDSRIVVTGDVNDDTGLVLARYNAEGDFALSFSQATETMAPGTKARITLNIARLGGYTGNVTITPPDTSALDIRISPNPVTTSDDSVTFKVKVRGDTPLGPRDLVFAAQSDAGQAHSITLTLVVQ